MRIKQIIINNLQSKAKGFTLIELMIYMGVLAIFIGTLSTLFSTSVNIQLESQNLTSVEQDGRYILARLIYDSHRATSVTTPASLGASNSSLVLVISGVNYTFDLDASGNLRYVNNLGTFQLNSHDTSLSSLSFQRIGNVGGDEDTIVVSFQIASRVETIPPTPPKDFSTVIALRRQ